MKKKAGMRVAATVLGLMCLAGSLEADSSCSLTVGGEELSFPHVVAVATKNWFDDSLEDVDVYCFRVPVPEDKRSSEAILWFENDNHITISIAAPQMHVGAVRIHTEEVSASISGIGFGVDFEGSRSGDRLSGTISTPEPKSTLSDGERGPEWKLSAELDLQVWPQIER